MPIAPIGIFFVSGIDSFSNFYYNTPHKDRTKLRRLENEKLHLFNDGIRSISVYWSNRTKRSPSIWWCCINRALRITCNLLGNIVHRLCTS